MKRIFLTFALTSTSIFSNAQVGVGTTTPDASSVLEVQSTTQGMLTPRMTNAQRAAISTPATGLIVYQTDGTAGFYYYTGSAWALLINGTDALPAVNGSAVTNLNATNITTGTISPARMGSGTADNTTYLRGDGTWSTVSSGNSLPNQSGKSGRFLTTDGTNTYWTSGFYDVDRGQVYNLPTTGSFVAPGSSSSIQTSLTSTTSGRVIYTCPFNGQVLKMVCSTPTIAAGNTTITIYKNGLSTGISANVNMSNIGTSYTFDFSNAYFNEGDLISFWVVPSNNISNADFGFSTVMHFTNDINP